MLHGAHLLVLFDLLSSPAFLGQTLNVQRLCHVIPEYPHRQVYRGQFTQRGRTRFPPSNTLLTTLRCRSQATSTGIFFAGRSCWRSCSSFSRFFLTLLSFGIHAGKGGVFNLYGIRGKTFHRVQQSLAAVRPAHLAEAP